MSRTVFLFLLSTIGSAVCGIFIDRVMTVAPLEAVVLAFVLCAFFVADVFFLSHVSSLMSNKNLTEDSEPGPLELPKSELGCSLSEIWYLYDLVGSKECVVDRQFD